MNQEQKKLIARLRSAGLSYGKIAATVGLSVNTVKSYCFRNPQGEASSEPVAPVRTGRCPQCNAILEQTPGHRQKRFCSSTCRRLWWAAHPEQMVQRKLLTVECRHCGKSFEKYGSRPRQFCSRQCYLAHRYGQGGNEKSE